MSTSHSTILFSIKTKNYNYLSNDYILPMYVNGTEYYHVTGFVLSQKFASFNEKLSYRISKLYSPIICRKISSETVLTKNIESEWNNKKLLTETRIGIMIKFLSNDEYANKLLSTGTKLLINTEGDNEYWGRGKSRNGRNMLGLILMDVRNKIRDLLNDSLNIVEPSKSIVALNTKLLLPVTELEERVTVNGKHFLSLATHTNKENISSNDDGNNSSTQDDNKTSE